MNIIKKLIAWIFGIGLLLWLGAKLILDAIERAVTVDDFAHLDGYVAQALVLLFKAPWWVPAALASALIITQLFRGSKPTGGQAAPSAIGAAEDDYPEEEEEPEKKEQHLVPIHKAIDHIAKCIDDSVTKDCFVATRSALRQHASDGTIRMRGRKQIDDPIENMAFSEAETDIPKDYWAISTIGPLAVGPDFLDGGHTFPEPVNAWGRKGLNEKKGYSRVRVDWDDIIKLWPVLEEQGS
jgi:hypothetical protein